MRPQPTILIADDDEAIRELLAIYLKNEGYALRFAKTGQEVLDVVAHEAIDLLILDWMMPVMDGIEACIEIRKTQFMPILMLTAKTSDLDLMQGISIGADDYMKKPFNPLEVTLRVKSLLRRYRDYGADQSAQSGVLIFDDVTLDIQTRQCTKGDTSIRLTPKEFDILAYFMRHPNQVLTVEQIYEAVWGEDAFEVDNTVMVHITKIREKIEETPRKPSYIKTVWGVGYRL
ncbi:response regulator transcription factor [Exiguobacterium sp. SH3S2]|uniref:response regulator transcription factor n=1 Tax=unclassified Exiguobacterium TaxID=2644629 RepID=UPI0008AC5A2A|nr:MULTISPECIES: response regulator transcription factor [unclassified Exiguobacterium]OGX78743.1 DNA-binding response regulator [Exiguobacterium sp. SH31]TCI34050.1 response regulator transcription factor [Exiguobacterium sp. SH4S7]TCI42909.1 response regulator transcription factor [Exiguobacterium sp. SH3S3]TCI43040.1 response regulator transcription factor [Exiguobacterium sp. SH5S32]TCI49826.1 response regulator transcription factor [Exiguobacterium sp. SH1S4]